MFYKVIYDDNKEMIISNKNSAEEAERIIKLTKGNVDIKEIIEYDYDIANNKIVTNE